MADLDWIKEFPTPITVCDANGVVLAMNDLAARNYEKDGGYGLIGRSMLDCHPDPARGKAEALLAARQKNVYTVEKNGIRKLIFQSPWYHEGRYAGFVQISMEIPWEMPHFVRS